MKKHVERKDHELLLSKQWPYTHPGVELRVMCPVCRTMTQDKINYLRTSNNKKCKRYATVLLTHDATKAYDSGHFKLHALCHYWSKVVMIWATRTWLFNLQERLKWLCCRGPLNLSSFPAGSIRFSVPDTYQVCFVQWGFQTVHPWCEFVLLAHKSAESHPTLWPEAALVLGGGGGGKTKAQVCGRTPAEIVGSNPTGAWMFFCCECCVLSGRGLCDELITRTEESYRRRVWHREWGGPGPGDCWANRKYIYIYIYIYIPGYS